MTWSFWRSTDELRILSADELRILFDLPLCIPYNENDKDGKNASGIQTGSVPESDSRTVTFEIKLKS